MYMMGLTAPSDGTYRTTSTDRLLRGKCPNDKGCYGWTGLGLFDPKSALAVTMPIATAFKFCIGHRKNGLLNR
jgi:hypothetical protein